MFPWKVFVGVNDIGRVVDILLTRRKGFGEVFIYARGRRVRVMVGKE